MAKRCNLTFDDSASYADAIEKGGVKLTITGAGDFSAQLVRLELKQLVIYRQRERLPRIAYISLPSEKVFLSFPVGPGSLVLDGFILRRGDIVFHSPGQHVHQRSQGECQWGLISLSPEQLAHYSKALTGRPIAIPEMNKILSPARPTRSRFHHLFREACDLAETKRSLIERPEVARALEQQLLHAIIHCLTADEVIDSAKTRHRHAALMARFETVLSRQIDQRLTLTTLCKEVGVPARTLRMCCSEFLGVGPMRYLTLRRLNNARAALRRADPSTASVAGVARKHHFTELGRFAVLYRTTFGELPSTTLQTAPQTVSAEIA
jgi:AraC-like DNA-binding protein